MVKIIPRTYSLQNRLPIIILFGLLVLYFFSSLVGLRRAANDDEVLERQGVTTVPPREPPIPLDERLVEMELRRERLGFGWSSYVRIEVDKDSCITPQHQACLPMVRKFFKRQKQLAGLPNEKENTRRTKYGHTTVIAPLDYPGLFEPTNWHWTFQHLTYAPFHPDGDIPKQTLPQALIIGPAESGTRALCEFLSIHSQIVPRCKPLNFFNNPERLAQGPKWYRLNMPMAYSDQVVIERSPNYFASPDAPAEVLNLLGKSTKVIMVLRSPLERLESYLKRTNFSQTDGCDVTHLTSAKQQLGQIPCIAEGLFASHLRNWLKQYPLSQMYIVDSTKLMKEPLAVLQNVEKFLEMENQIQPQNLYFDKITGFYCKVLPIPGARPDCTVSDNDVDSESTLTANKNVLNPQSRKILLDYYRPHNQELFNLIKQKLDWDS